MSALFAKLFEPEDLLLLEPQEAQLAEVPEDKRLELGWQFKEGGSAFTIWWHPTTPLLEGGRPGAVPVFAGGALRRHAEYAVLWALFSRHKPRVPVALTKIVRRYVQTLGERRVELQAAASNGGACGWARLIGFEQEARLIGAAPDGGDMIVFVRRGLL